MVYPALLPLISICRLPVVDGTVAPADLNELVRFAERRNLVSARVSSHFKRNLPQTCAVTSLTVQLVRVVVRAVRPAVTPVVVVNSRAVTAHHELLCETHQHTQCTEGHTPIRMWQPQHRPTLNEKTRLTYSKEYIRIS